MTLSRRAKAATPGSGAGADAAATHSVSWLVYRISRIRQLFEVPHG
jgi:hypothetical protein